MIPRKSRDRQGHEITVNCNGRQIHTGVRKMADYEGTYSFDGEYLRAGGVAIPEDIAVAHLNVKDKQIEELVGMLKVFVDARNNWHGLMRLTVKKAEALVAKHKGE